MMVHLIRAQLWRVRWLLLNLAFLGAAGAMQSDLFGSRLMTAMPLMMATAALATLGMFWLREVRVLPIHPYRCT